MKTILLQSSLVLALILPSFAYAAFSDVTLTTSTVLSVSSYTLNVTGSSAVIQSIVVNPTNFSVTLSSGSSIQVSSPTYNQLSVDVATFTASNNCAANTSVLTLFSSGPSGTVTVSPQPTICSAPAPTSSGGGGVGGNGPIVGSITTQAVPPSVSTTSTSSISALQNEVTLLTAQLNALLLQAHGGTIPSVFTRNLSLGMTGDDVNALQAFLISEASGSAAFRLKAHGTTQYFGSLTYSAVQEFQKKAGIIPASGFFGPITRAYVNGLQK